MGKTEWELLAVSQGRGGQYYMELCDGDSVRREPIEPHEAQLLLVSLASGKTIYATELDKPAVEVEEGDVPTDDA